MADARPGAGLDLAAARDFGQILDACLRLYLGHFTLFAGLALVIVVPIDLIVLGLGAEQLWSPYDADPPLGVAVLAGLSGTLVITPLITSSHALAVLSIGGGRTPSLGEALDAGLRVFPTALLIVVLYGLGVFAGTLLLIVPGIYLSVRWYVAVQAAVVDGWRGRSGLTRSGNLVRGSWWRVFGISIALILLGTILSSAPGLAFDVLADSADLGVLQLTGRVLGDAIGYSFVALSGTLLYFDLRARHVAQGASATA